MNRKNRWLAAVMAIIMLGTLTAFAMQEQKTEGPTTVEGGTELPILADAAMYRGNVTAITQRDGDTLITLEQVEGTNFGNAAMTFRITKDTVRGFETEQLVEGAYFEVQYGVSGGAGKPFIQEANTVRDAITAMILTPAQFAVFNGEIVSIEEGGAGAKYSMLMQPLGGGEVVLFHVAEDTKIYMDENDIKTGVRLNLFTRGARTMSIPAQGAALEIRPYYDPAQAQAGLITVQ